MSAGLTSPEYTHLVLGIHDYFGPAAAFCWFLGGVWFLGVTIIRNFYVKPEEIKRIQPWSTKGNLSVKIQQSESKKEQVSKKEQASKKDGTLSSLEK